MPEITFEEVLNAVRNLPLPERQRLKEWLAQENHSKEALVDENGLSRQSRFECEMRWLDEHRIEYAGQWVALDGDRLIAAGKRASDIFAAADASGVHLPLIVRVNEGEDLPFGGWY